MHGHSEADEDHPLTRAWIAALRDAARARGTRLEWVNCGLCVDERGMEPSIEGTRRGSPADLARFIHESDNTLVVPTSD